MSPRDWTLRIEDILQAIDRITQYTKGMTWETFSADQRTLDAVIRNVEVIGEASRHVPEDIIARYPRIPWAEMRGMRNILIHEYFLVSVSILWQTATHNLPPLVPELQQILDENRDSVP
jgi:uncharacterized protein with HEPN domain